jgi:protein SCO1
LTSSVVTGPVGGSRSRTWAFSLLALLATGVTLAAFARSLVRHEPPPVVGQVPSFALIEASGRPVTDADLRGRPWVADFIFTRCAGACPAMTARMAALRAEVPADVQFVSITVDPAHDTPEVLARYARLAGGGPGWLFLSGSRDDLFRLSIEGFKLGVQEVPAESQSGGDGPFIHSSHFVLVDGTGRIRGYYDSTEAEALSRLRKDLAAVRSERR